MHETADRDLSVWLGGSVMASLGEAFLNNWISKSEYEETGSAVVHSYCQTSLLDK
jgi:actin-related protein